MNRLLEFAGLVMFAWLLVLAFAWTCGHAAFQPGIVNPTTPIPAADSTALGSTLQRYDLTWRGEARFTGSLVTAHSTTPVLTVATGNYNGTYSAAIARPFCGWVGSVLDQHPEIRHVIVGNEPLIVNPEGYASVLSVCAPVVRAHGAKVIGPGLMPAGAYVIQRFLDAIAARGRGLLDAFDFHPYYYSSLSYDAEIVRRVHATLGARVQTWVGEDGIQSIYPGWSQWYSVSEAEQAKRVSAGMIAAYCSGASAWMNFLMTDQNFDKGWQSGLRRVDGSRKPAFRATAAAIRAGKVNCASPAPPTPAQKPKTRRARVSHRYVCAQAYKGAELPATRRNIMRGVCVVAG